MYEVYNCVTPYVCRLLFQTSEVGPRGIYLRFRPTLLLFLSVTVTSHLIVTNAAIIRFLLWVGSFCVLIFRWIVLSCQKIYHQIRLWCRFFVQEVDAGTLESKIIHVPLLRYIPNLPKFIHTKPPTSNARHIA